MPEREEFHIADILARAVNANAISMTEARFISGAVWSVQAQRNRRDAKDMPMSYDEITKVFGNVMDRFLVK